MHSDVVAINLKLKNLHPNLMAEFYHVLIFKSVIKLKTVFVDVNLSIHNGGQTHYFI